MQGSRSTVPYLLAAWLSTAWLAGVAASAAFGAAAWPLALALAATAGAVAIRSGKPAPALYAAALPAVFLAGVAWEHASRPALADDAVAHFNDGVSMRLRGVVRDDPDRGDTSQRFTVDVRTVERGGAWVDASGGVQVTTGLLPERRAGDELQLEGQLQSPPQLEDFDYAQYLALRGVGSVMVYPDASTVGHEDQGRVRGWLLDARRALSRGMGLALPEPQAALAKGVLLGERSALPAETIDDLNATNTSHLVVVSGSNVVLVAAFATLLFGAFVRRRRAQALSIAAVVAYAALVGFSPPVARATIMGIVLVLAGMSGRRTHGITSIVLAGALMAAWNPMVVRDVSFQLSFAATAGIITLAAPLRRGLIAGAGWTLRRDDVPRWFGGFVAEPAAVTIAAIIATAPLIAFNFGRMSLVALPANMLIVPAFPFILLASGLAAAGGLLPFGHVAFGAPAYWLLTYWLEVAGWFAGLPMATGDAGWYSAPAAVATYGVIIVTMPIVVRWLRRADGAQLAESRPFRWPIAMRRIAFVAPVALLLGSAGWIVSETDEARLEVTVLDVGQGDAILIETPSGGRVLVDGGPGGAVLRGLGRELPWHDRAIDLVVLTHPQADHGTGLLDVFQRYDVERVLAREPSEPSTLFAELDDAIVDEDASMIEALAGDSLDLGDGVRMDVLWPPADLPADSTGNNNGIVLMLSYNEVRFLLSADIEAPAEEALAAAGADLRATVLKVAHHGSKTSSTRAFLDAVAPQVAVVSAGLDNQYGHPAPGVVARLDDYGTVYTTAGSGDVHFETDGERLWVDAGE